MKGKDFSRREFLKTGTLAATAALLINNPILNYANPDEKTPVVLIRDMNVLGPDMKVNYEVVQSMLDEAVKKLFGTKDAATAWKKIIKPSDIVGIKTNVWRLGTPPEVENALKKGVLSAGVDAAKISINDKSVLRDANFQKATALINTRPMRTHYWSGVGSLLKNYIMFVPKPSDYHPDSCADLGAIWNLPQVKGKTRLNVLVMLTPMFHSVGPHGYSPEHIWNYCGLIVGEDPVACDSVGLRIIEAKRRDFFKEDKPLNPHAKHIEYADTRHHIGTADRNKINLIKIGTSEGILI